MNPMKWIALPVLFCCASVAAAQPANGWPSPLPITVGQAAQPPVADGVPVRVVEYVEAPMPGGQEHWLALNFTLGQPSTGRVGIKVLDRENNSLWLEAYGGSALYDAMYGFGARIQHTAWSFGHGDSFFISPGLGVHILPDWYASQNVLHYNRRRGYWATSSSNYSTLYFLAGDVDFSWLHDFSPRFGFELGLKLGLAGRLGGRVGDDYPESAMWGKNLYPIVAFYSGLRF
jgi:hypothetical protein